MTHTDFVVLIQKVYRSLFNTMNGLQSQGSLTVEILTSLGLSLPPAQAADNKNEKCILGWPQ